MEAGDRALLDATVRSAIADAPVDTAGVDRVLADLGWLEMLDAEPRDALHIVFGALGAANAPATVLDDVVVSALGSDPSPDVAVLLPKFATWEPPGRVARDGVQAKGLGTARLASAREIVVVCRAGDELQLVTADASAVGTEVVTGVDPDAGYRSLTLRDATGRSDPLDPAAWEEAVALARRAVAHQIASASRAMLDLARTHAVEREQFGRPIARFQAVRHRLAEALVAVEGLEATLDAAGDEPSAPTAALAKAAAGRTARTVAGHCQQVLAGVGFTTDHSFHRYLKRVLVLEGLFGTADEIVFDLGRWLLAERRVPTLIEL